MSPAKCRHGLAVLWMVSVSCVQAQITTRDDAVGKLLNSWYDDATAAGLTAITYENRDGQHSPLNTAQYPQLQIFRPDSQSGPPTGPALGLRLRPMIGNCSMAAPADKGGSLPRLYHMDPKGQQFLMMQYLANNLILYPEHQDHDIGANGIGGYGDLYPTNNACLLISQGSSGTDQPFLQAMVSTIAALPVETQKLLIEKRVLMPTLQSIFRRSNRMLKEERDYFGGRAHPVVFDAAQLDEEKMVQLAHEMKPPLIPPLVQIQVEQETEWIAGRDYFEAEKVVPYKLGDTPVSITRVMRGNVPEMGMVVTAQKTADLMGRPVQIRWQLLQGDPRAVRVESSGTGPHARLRVRWQPPLITPTGIRSHRVDIGVFATNGLSVSAPAFLSFYMLPNEMHFYDAQGRVSEVYYQAHNPDLGLPSSARDVRWLRGMLDLSIHGDGLRSRLMAKLLRDDERQLLQKTWVTLNPRLQAIEKLEADPQKKDSAARLRSGLEEDIEKALSQPMPGEPQRTVRAGMEAALAAVAGFTDLYPSFQKELLTLAAQSSKGGAGDAIRRDIQRLVDLGVVIEEASGGVALANAPERVTEADRYYLSGLNLLLLSEVLFPDFLQRSLAPAWVDPRLTTPKPWRDVHRYDEEGKRLGWIRHQAGRTAWFDTQGRLLPEGPKQPEKAQSVVYEKNANGLLEWRTK